MTRVRTIGLAGLLTWLTVGAPILVSGSGSPARLAAWTVLYLLFGAAFAADLTRPSLLFLAVEAVCVIGLVLLLCDGFEGALLVLVAMRLGARVSRRAGAAWITVQTLLFAGAIAVHWSPRPAFLLAPPYFGFQLLAFFTFEALERETSAKVSLSRSNAELTALAGVIADSSRIAERLRIAHELHDSLGHHLTVLTLNLEAALLKTSGDARQDVETAQALARRILADIRSIVAAQRSGDGVDLPQALRTLVAGVPRPVVHLEIDGSLRPRDPERCQILLRCAQEIVTNAARHSGAENLWLVVEHADGGFRLRARDDGRGRDEARDDSGGSGLHGMRSRLEEAGGSLSVETGPGRGFGVVAFLPETAA